VTLPCPGPPAPATELPPPVERCMSGRWRVSLIDPMQSVAVAAKNDRLPQQSLVIVVACLSVFYSRSHMLDFYFSPIIDSNNRMYHPVHSYISIFSLSQHQHSTLNHFRIYFVDNKIEKIIK
jgi:hypothetical protein